MSCFSKNGAERITTREAIAGRGERALKASGLNARSMASSCETVSGFSEIWPAMRRAGWPGLNPQINKEKAFCCWVLVSLGVPVSTIEKALGVRDHQITSNSQAIHECVSSTLDLNREPTEEELQGVEEWLESEGILDD
ncbi:hypothetical protein KOR42_32800 [Thalassoglobus neptunius]|uniref:Uncharacterized protein n=1 Tax=Thalassoglobus neptunius TaxID=1938619 RepID=A0A5C5WMF6_9PLAN|nr:hypothetical protein [Thalassoglobus neptunius]TWT51807.1 hypothetical protein KOR42_32800 [Thalassoglobus neptunius]